MSSLIVACISAAIALVALGMPFGMLVVYPALLFAKKSRIQLSLFMLSYWVMSAILVLSVVYVSSFWNISHGQAMLTKIGGVADGVSIILAGWQIYTQYAQKKGIAR